MVISEPSPVGDGDSIRVEVIRAWPRRLTTAVLELPAGATVADALTLAGSIERSGESESGDHPPADDRADEQGLEAQGLRAPSSQGQGTPGQGFTTMAVAIFGERVESSHVLASGDRIEVLRPLLADPKDARRRRAKK